MERRRTVCNRDCPDVCSVWVSVEGGRAVSLRGDRNHPITRGALCSRTARFLEARDARERILTPLVRGAHGFVPIDWERALDLIVERLTRVLAESGPSAVLYYRSGGSLGLLKRVVDSFFDRLGPCARVRGDICTGAGQAAQVEDFGVCDGHDLEDVLHARQIVLWGKDVATTSPHTARVLLDARAKGAQITLIDPVHTATVRLADLHLQPRAGGDFALAMATARALFERGAVADRTLDRCENVAAYRALLESRALSDWCARAGVPVAAAHELARRMSERPCASLVGWALARRTHGAASVRAIDALGVVSGNLGIEGGGVTYYRRRERGFGEQLRPLAGAPGRILLEPLLAEHIAAQTDPPIRMVWVGGANPVAMLPDSYAVQRALRSREFVVVVDWRMTDTAECADLILPTTTWLEEDDLLGSYGHHYVSASTPALRRPASVRSDLEIVQALAQRLGFGAELAGSAGSWKERMLGADLLRRGLTPEALARGALRHPDAPAVPFVGGRVATPSGKVRLLTSAPPTAPDDADFPLQLLALAARDAQGSQWSSSYPVPAVVRVHPDAVPGIAQGALATLRSRLGSMRVRVLHDARQRPELVLAVKGGALRDGTCFNALIGARLTDLGGGGALYDERVRLVAD